MKTTSPAGGFRIAASALAVLLLAPALARAAEGGTTEKSWRLDLGADHASRYLFRGLDLLNGQPVWYPHVTGTFGALTAYWYSYRGELGVEHRSGRLPSYDENDFGIEVAHAFGSLKVTLGGVAYTYREPDIAATKEAYLIASLKGGLAPKLSVYYDFDLYDGAYASLGVSHALDVGHGLTLTPEASYGYSFGWTQKAFGFAGANTPNDLLFGVDLAWQKGPLAIHGTVQKSVALSAVDTIGQGDLAVYTLGGSYTF